VEAVFGVNVQDVSDEGNLSTFRFKPAKVVQALSRPVDKLFTKTDDALNSLLVSAIRGKAGCSRRPAVTTQR
jgi:hypothetical protein